MFAVCSRVPARARACSTGPYTRAGPAANERDPAAPFCRSEYHYRYISAPINMEMRLINPPNKPSRRYVAFPRVHPLWFWTGSSNDRPNNHLMMLGNKVQSGFIAQYRDDFREFSSVNDVFYCEEFIFLLNIFKVQCIIFGINNLFKNIFREAFLSFLILNFRFY